MRCRGTGYYQWQGGAAVTVDLTGEAALQNIAPNTVVEFRFANYNKSTFSGSGYAYYGIGNKSGNDIVIEGSTSPIPEPGTIALAGLALMTLGVRRRRAA